jgi:hypothetical protein
MLEMVLPLSFHELKRLLALAKWIVEMAKRGMVLKPGEVLDFVESIINKEKRQTSFKSGRPSHDWLYAFMAINSAILQVRKETMAETCREKVTKEKTDEW